MCKLCKVLRNFTVLNVGITIDSNLNSMATFSFKYLIQQESHEASYTAVSFIAKAQGPRCTYVFLFLLTVCFGYDIITLNAACQLCH